MDVEYMRASTNFHEPVEIPPNYAPSHCHLALMYVTTCSASLLGSFQSSRRALSQMQLGSCQAVDGETLTASSSMRRSPLNVAVQSQG